MEETVVKEAMETTAAVAQDAAQEVAKQKNPVPFVVGGVIVLGIIIGCKFYLNKKAQKSVEPAKPAQANKAEAVEPEVVNNEEEVKPENLN